MFTTGSPAGVGVTHNPPEQYLLRPGDCVEIEIEGLGRLRNYMFTDSSAAGGEWDARAESLRVD